MNEFLINSLFILLFHRAFIDNVNLQILSMDDNEQFSDLPVNLFHGNLNLIELSLRNNKLYQLDAVQLPLDQLRKLSLAENPFVCNCSLIWLWQLIKSSSAVTESTMTTTTTTSSMTGDSSGGGGSEEPVVMANGSGNLFIIDGQKIGCDIVIRNDDDNMKIIRKRLVDMSEADISCPTHIVTIISVILTVIFIAIICVSILVIIKCSRTAQLKRRQQKYLTSERQNVGELIIPQKIDKYELERYLAEQQLQHQQKQQQIQQQYQLNSHHTIQPVHAQQNQYTFQHQNSLIKPNNEYRSLKKWENGGGGNGGIQYPSLNTHHHHTLNPTLITSASPLKKKPPTPNSILNGYVHSNQQHHNNHQDETEPPQEQIYSNHPDDDEMSNVEEDHYEHFDDSYLNSLNSSHKLTIQSTLPLTKPHTATATTLFNSSNTNINNINKNNSNGSSKKSLHNNNNNVKPHIVYV